MKRTLPLLALSVILAACQGDHSAQLDVTQGYDSFGDSITPENALPVNALSDGGVRLIGQSVKLEGRVSEVCEMAGCWMTIQVADGPLVLIDVPRDENGAYLFTFPEDAPGRRAVIAGVLEGDRDHHDADHGMAHHGGDGDGEGHHGGGDPDGHDADHGEHDMAGEHADHDMGGHSEQENCMLTESTFTLVATGALIERVRA